ncbi:HicB family protein [Rubinisphaera italica]|uniref:HicB family protein n=1 Tax=Rubinisphaera italica TaxID=2527969 RepID=A0A5C5XJ74_9PLAN|nr:type II toxin-antitoxin system HicB family antitoxin [Rubinisphaera italica]TWT63237.1 HicB family protein [Rubinisphaera italica]
MMEYKGYIGKVEFDDQAEIFHGEIINTRDVITFQGQSVVELSKAFRESIDDYLAFCTERGESPDKPFSGQFVTRIPPELHRQINIAAALAGKSLNAFVTEQLQAAIQMIGGSRKDTSKIKKKKAAKTSSRKKKDIEQRA